VLFLLVFNGHVDSSEGMLSLLVYVIGLWVDVVYLWSLLCIYVRWWRALFAPRLSRCVISSTLLFMMNFSRVWCYHTWSKISAS